ncbi:MAG: DUF3616 domain-containing protein [Betaproteobacteria bacterium]|nr:DUF3616 domain-containing protein [Betaproteobacteria bacterium]
MISAPTVRFLPLSGVYEPSAIQQLADGRFLVVEDEKQHPFSLVSVDAAGRTSSTTLSPGWFEGDQAIWKLDDLEGLAVDRAGHVYVLTSHSRDGDGDEKKSRDRLARLRIEGERIVESVVAGGLKRALTAAHPLLAAAAEIRDVKSDGGLNIEAIDISPDQQRLLIGFRSPLQDGRAIIASVDNPGAIFDAGASPSVSATLETLDLGGNGIRGMAYMPALNGYLIIGGPAARLREHFGLWFWSGAPSEPARRVAIDGLPGFEHAEGISPAIIEGTHMVIIVSDDGDRAKGRCAHYVLLHAAQLRVEP